MVQILVALTAWIVDRAQTASRWLLRPIQRRYEWQQDRRYWLMLGRATSKLFGLRKWFFSTRFTAHAAAETTSIYASIVRAIAFQSVKAVLAVAVLVVIDRWLVNHQSHILATLPGAQSYYEAVKALGTPDGATVYSNVLSTVAQITGVFLGLYFTAASVVVSTGYAQVTPDIRNLLISDKVGNAYIRALAFASVLSLSLLIWQAVGGSENILGLISVGGALLLAVFGFVNLGWRAFYLFDAPQLVGWTLEDLRQWATLSTYQGYRSRALPFRRIISIRLRRP